jgi:hypothetical protein
MPIDCTIENALIHGSFGLKPPYTILVPSHKWDGNEWKVRVHFNRSDGDESKI